MRQRINGHIVDGHTAVQHGFELEDARRLEEASAVTEAFQQGVETGWSAAEAALTEEFGEGGFIQRVRGILAAARAAQQKESLPGPHHG